MNSTLSTHKKQMIEALEKTLGIVTTACKMVGIDRSTHYVWLRNDMEYKKEVESIDDITLDFVESQLHKRVKDGDTASICFYLKTKGKKRGYIERQEITGVDSGPLKLEITVIGNDEPILHEPE